MQKIKTILPCITAILFLIFLGSCNLPRLSPAEVPTTSGGDTTEDVEPTAPANTDGADTIRIPGGTFTMGSTELDTAAADDEKPAHQVTVGSFYLYTHEVTNTMYQACVDAGVCIPITVLETGPTSHYADPAFASYPVTGVDWNMAHDYCSWAGSRLPTEAEWEYAARGAENLPYPWGAEEPTCNQVNMLGCIIPPDVVEAGSYLLGNSTFEVWDMSGNVWEWVQDWYGEHYYTFSPTVDPLGPGAPDVANHPLKVVHGGGFDSVPEQMRSANRAAGNPYRVYDDVGFRCVAEGENLPAGYTETRDRHEMVPPDPLDGGGVPLEDPETTPYASMGRILATCPAEDGLITIYAEVESSVSGEWSLTVEEIPFDCIYDPDTRLLSCSGPTPATTEHPGAYHVKIYFPGGDLIRDRFPEIPTDCDSISPDPGNMWFEQFCDIPEGDWIPEGDLINVGIYTDIPIRWDDISSSGESLACWQLLDTETHCLLPLDPTDPARTDYLLSMRGWGPGRIIAYERHEVISVSIECLGTPRGTNVEPFCFEGLPTVHLSFTPEGTVLDTITTDGTPLDCIGMTPVDMYCGPLPGAAGTSIPLTTCFVGETCEDWTLTIPDCGPGLAHWYDTSVLPTCYPSIGPVVVIHYTPAEQPLTSAEVDDTALSCYGAPEPGWYMCSGLPGAPGDPGTLSFCLGDSTCFDESISTPDCGIAHWDDDWRLISVACTDNRSEISFMIDTFLGWLTPAASFTHTASDGEVTYSCSVHPTVAGRVYCEGPRPEIPGNLEYCIQREGTPLPVCQTFDIFPGWVAETICEQPVPQIPVTEVPVTEEPAPVDMCSVYTTYGSCVAHKDQCRWVTDHCESNP